MITLLLMYAHLCVKDFLELALKRVKYIPIFLQVLDHKTVLFVEEDRYVQGGQARTVETWGLDRIDQASNAIDNQFNVPCNLTGKGVDVYILDTGISERHSEIRGKVQTLTCGAYPQQSISCFAHGTHIAGTVGGRSLGVAPGVNIFSVKVLNCTNQGTWNTILQGIECVLNHTQHRGNQSAVVNMSLFGTKHRAIKKGIHRLIKQGITVVGIAGNTGNSDTTPNDACKTFPASVQGVIGVSASTRLDEAYRYSNAGVCVDLYAPGENILSASHSCEFCRDSRSGSSMAAPHVTGAIALLLERCPNLPPWKVHYHLLSHMTIPDKLNMRTIPKRLRRSTPNLLLHVSDAMCTLEC